MTPTPGSVLEMVSRALESSTDRVLASSIFRTTSCEEIAAIADGYAAEHWKQSVTKCWLFRLGSGAVFALGLESGARVLLKVHPPTASLQSLQAVYRVQELLRARAFPCPRVLVPPRAFQGTVVVALEYSTDGDARDAHDPVVRCAMAEAYAELIDRAKLFKLKAGLRSLVPGDRLWPAPHSGLFDFESSRPGAEWIEDIARRARSALERHPTRGVLAHADWNAKNMRFVHDEVAVVYDWDSLAVGDEMLFVGSAALHFTVNDDYAVDRRPSLDESRAFVRDYVRARGRPLTDEQRARLNAGAAYALSYTARCEHALDPKGEAYAGSFRELLSRAKNLDYFEK